MKININKQKGTLTLPEDFAELKEITGKGYFHYLIKYNIDIVKAMRDKAFLVKIHVSTKSASVQSPTGFTNNNNTEIINSLLIRNSQKKELYRSQVSEYILTVTSDITSKIPNSKAFSLTEKNANLDTLEPLFKNQKFNLTKVKDLTTNNILQPVFITPLSVKQSGNLNPQEASINLIKKYKTDPAIVGMKTNHYKDTINSYAGVIKKPTGVLYEALNEQVSTQNIQSKFTILNNVMGASKDKPTDQLGLSSTDYTYTISNELTNVVTIEEDLFIPISEISDQFYLLFELQDLKGVETESISSIVYHSRNLSIFTLPTIPPVMSVMPVNGGNKLEIKQIDTHGVGVFIYRKIIETQNVNSDADYLQIDRINLKPEQGTISYFDKISTSKSLIYRIIPYNRAGTKGHDFASAVLNPVNNFALKKKIQNKMESRITFLSLAAKIVDKSIQLELNKIPPGVLCFKVYKKDLSKFQKSKDLVGNPVYIGNINGNKPFFVTDTNVVNQRIYEYSVYLMYKEGDESWSSSIVNIQYNPIINNIIQTELGPIAAINSGNELDIQFDIISKVANGKIDQIKNAMQQQGILGFFQEDITTNRDKLQNLIAYQIFRTNITTSERENLGIFIGTKFSDRVTSKITNAKAIIPGNVYEYTINTHFRTAESLIDTFTKTVVDSTNPNNTYSFYPSKWYHPITIREGNLVTDSSIKRNHAESEFTFGIIGDIKYTRIALSDELPTIHDAVASTLGVDKILVQWKVQGNIKKIDHFLIIKEEMGQKTVIGKTHGLTETNVIKFIDTITDNNKNTNKTYEIAIIYHIVPIFFDYSQGSIVKTSQITAKKFK